MTLPVRPIRRFSRWRGTGVGVVGEGDVLAGADAPGGVAVGVVPVLLRAADVGQRVFVGGVLVGERGPRPGVAVAGGAVGIRPLSVVTIAGPAGGLGGLQASQGGVGEGLRLAAAGRRGVGVGEDVAIVIVGVRQLLAVIVSRTRAGLQVHQPKVLGCGGGDVGRRADHGVEQPCGM